MTDPRAFPSAAIDPAYGGMSQRDWFAGMAIATASIGVTQNDFAARTWKIADAMMVELEKRSAKP